MRSLIRVLSHVKPNHVDFLTKYMVQLPLWLPLTRIEEAMHQVLPGSFQPAQQIKTLNFFTHWDLIVFLITPLYWLCHNSKKIVVFEVWYSNLHWVCFHWMHFCGCREVWKFLYNMQFRGPKKVDSPWRNAFHQQPW